MNQISDKLAENEYYHGTLCYKAFQILYEGFRLKKYYTYYGNSGTFKQGIYLTKSLSSAAYFGWQYVFKCQLQKGVSIIRINLKYDQKVINYLKREFSKDILTGPLNIVIPRNKHLTRNELIQLLNYRFCKAKFSPRNPKKCGNWFNSIDSFRQHVQLHNYDGFGESESLDGVVIFNPSLVEPIELYEVFECGRKPCEFNPKYNEPVYSLRTMDKLGLMISIDQYYKEYVESSSDFNDSLSQEDIKEWEYIRSLQKKYCQEHGLVGRGY
jgi:hypothetical protein